MYVVSNRGGNAFKKKRRRKKRTTKRKAKAKGKEDSVKLFLVFFIELSKMALYCTPFCFPLYSAFVSFFALPFFELPFFFVPEEVVAFFLVDPSFFVVAFFAFGTGFKVSEI